MANQNFQSSYHVDITCAMNLWDHLTYDQPNYQSPEHTAIDVNAKTSESMSYVCISSYTYWYTNGNTYVSTFIGKSSLYNF